MYAGAAVSTVNLILVLAVTADAKVYHAVLGHRLTAVQVSQLNTLTITRVIVSCLVPVAVWLWMAWANGQGRNWARVLFRMLFTLATWTAVLPQTVMSIRIRFVPVVYMPFVPGLRPIIPVLTGLVVPVLTGLVALAAMFLLGSRPTSRSSGRVTCTPCAGADARTRADPIVQRTRADPIVQRTVGASGVSRAGLRACAGVARRAPRGPCKAERRR